MTQASANTTPSGPGAGMDDINIPLVAVGVALFGCVLAVLIIGLQAWFLQVSNAEKLGKTLPQENPRTKLALTQGEPRTELGRLLQKQRAELLVPPAERKAMPAGGAVVATTTTSAATASQPARKLWIPIDTAMRIVSREYSGGTGP